VRRRNAPEDGQSVEETDVDTALVLSGGSINGIFLQLGFLQALRSSGLWPRIGWIYGTSAGALSGWAVAHDALDEHERFLMEMQPADVFAAHDLWRTPFVGLHRYTLPDTVSARLGDPVELARELRAGPRELTVVTTDIGLSLASAASADPFECAFSSRKADPETFVAALFASAAISTFVLPLRIGDSVFADGGWVRNFPLAYAYREPRVQQIVGCRYSASASGLAGRGLHSLHNRISRLARIKLARGVEAELRQAIERQERGEPMHLIDTIARLSHIAVYRNSDLEVQLADERDRSILAAACVREHMQQAIVASTRGGKRSELLVALDEAFENADFPLERKRVVPRLVVDVAAPDGTRLDISRRQTTWSDEEKLTLVAHGRRLTERALDAWPQTAAARRASTAA
jgi:predicted acylesterase/phospholipase RssA